MKRILQCVIIALLGVAISGCEEKQTYRIGISQCSQDDWRKKMNDEINREIMLHPEATVEIRSADDSNEKQISDIRYFKDNGFDIIIAAPNEADAITPVIKEVYESGIPVVVFDRDINGTYYTARQGVDNVAIGEGAARYARNLTGEGGKVIEIYGLSGSTPAKERHEGFMRKGKELGLEVMGSGLGNWNYEDAVPMADSLFDLYGGEVDLVFAHNDRMAIAASDVARKRGLDVKVIGIDAAPEIGIKGVADGVIDATFLYPTEGYRLIRTALAILEGKPYEREVKLPLASAVDKSNADILLLQNESLKEETDKIRLLKSQVNDYWQQHSAQTTLLYAAIAILLLSFGFIFMILRTFWQHKRHQKELLDRNRLLEEQRDTEKALNEQLNEATQSKLMFFTNVSHDLRTPLTLIAEPVEQLSEATNLTPRQLTLIRIANKNVKILRRLINQILDFRKYENGKLDINLTEVMIASLVKEWAESFVELAHKRHIRFTVEIGVDPDFTLALDSEKIERVFFNLVSNAFKYTPGNGKIQVSCQVEDGQFILSVADTGRGISEEDLGNIFGRFYQVDKIHPDGSGIGLSLAKAFIEQHGGTILAESELGSGSRFTVRIPVRHVAVGPEEEMKRVIPAADVEAELGEIEMPEAGDEEGKPLLLIVDDNEDIRLMVRELLGDDYRIIEASDGKEGVRCAVKYVPDLMICDVMMPVMDGLECCRRVKEEVSTSHVPVLMLTACSLDEQRIQGYESGADGYLSKPFNSHLLRKRCENLIANRKRIKEIWRVPVVSARQEPESDPHSDSGSAGKGMPKVKTIDCDNEFYARFLTIVKEKMGEQDLSVDILAAELGLGRSQFYRKIKALTNYSPVELLKILRLRQAHELLATTDRSVSEIAYTVGFSAPAYFTRCYREVYGETPSEARERFGKK